MGKALVINCGSALLLNWRPEVFEGYDTIVINCGSVALSAEVNGELNRRKLVMNAGDTRIIEAKGTLVDLGEDGSLDAGASYAGCFIVADEDILIAPGMEKALAGVNGLYTPETLYHPEDLDIAALGKVYAGTRRSYPAGARAQLANIALTAALVAGLPEGAVLWTPGRLSAFDEVALAAAAQRGIVAQAKTVECYESAAQRYAAVLKAGAFALVPDGYALVEQPSDLDAMLTTYGDRLFVRGNLVLRPADADALGRTAGLVVEKTLSLPVAQAAAFRAIGRAGTLKPYRGILWQAKGKETATHAQLDAALQAGITFTLEVNGQFNFADDVTAGDLACIESLSYKGMVEVPAALKPLLAAKVASGKGVLAESGAREDHSEMEGLRRLGVDPKDTSLVNMGNYRMV